MIRIFLKGEYTSS